MAEHVTQHPIEVADVRATPGDEPGRLLLGLCPRERRVADDNPAWTAPWLAAVALWTDLVLGIDFEFAVSHYLFGLYVGLLIGTPCYLAWQIVALAVRQLMAWLAGRTSLPT